MNDQAQSLRRLMKFKQEMPPTPLSTGNTRIITVTSGKGGVGKSNFTLNFALALQARGCKVLILDADLGLANLDVLMGTRPRYNLYHMLKQRKSVWEIIHESHGIQLIAGGTGLSELVHLTDQELQEFARQICQLNGHVDYILFDTGAGLTEQTLHFILSSDETIVVTTPEPPAITDAYALIKTVAASGTSAKIRLVVNRATGQKEGKQTADKIHMAARRFLQLDLPTLGHVLEDESVVKAVKMQTPFTIAFPNSRASKCVKELAALFLLGQHTAKPLPGVKGFLHSMMQWMKS